MRPTTRQRPRRWIRRRWAPQRWTPKRWIRRRWIRSISAAAVPATIATVLAVALTLVAGVAGAGSDDVPGGTPAGQGGAAGNRDGAPGDRSGTAGDRLDGTIARHQQRLRDIPGDWRTWAALGTAYIERARVTADPMDYPRAEAAIRRSLELRPEGNPDALVALGALANARHDFAAAREHAEAAIRLGEYDADAYAVLADALTQLGDPAATQVVQRLLDLRPGLAAYARGSYDLELRGRTGEAVTLMRAALSSAVDPHDVAFCRAHLGDLAWNSGDPAGADREYAAALAADPTMPAAVRGRARVAWAAGRLDAAAAGYAGLTRRLPVPGYLLEYADLLRAAGRGPEADEQVRLATTAHTLFVDGGGRDGLTASAIAAATGRYPAAVDAATGEWERRRHPDVADALAVALHLAGRDAEAIGYADRAVAANGSSADYRYHRGIIELSLGRSAAARDDLAAALRINPYFSPLGAPAARAALAMLAEAGGAR